MQPLILHSHHTSTPSCRSWTWVCATPDLQHGLGESPNVDMEEKSQEANKPVHSPLASSWRRGSVRTPAAREASCAGRWELFAILRRGLPRSRVVRDGSGCRSHSTFICKVPGPLEHLDVCSGPWPSRCGLAGRPFWDQKPSGTPFSVGRTT